MRASCSCAAAEPCDASEPSHDCTSPSPPTARGHPRAGSSRRERPPSRRGPTVPRPVSSGTQKTPRVLSHLGAMPCSGSRAILHAATSRPNARPPRRGCSAACGPATSPERPGVGAAARAAPGARGTGTSPGSSGGGPRSTDIFAPDLLAVRIELSFRTRGSRRRRVATRADLAAALVFASSGAGADAPSAPDAGDGGGQAQPGPGTAQPPSCLLRGRSTAAGPGSTWRTHGLPCSRTGCRGTHALPYARCARRCSSLDSPQGGDDDGHARRVPLEQEGRNREGRTA